MVCKSALLRDFVNIQPRRRPSLRRVYGGPRPRFYEFVKMKRLRVESANRPTRIVFVSYIEVPGTFSFLRMRSAWYMLWQVWESGVSF